MSMKNGIIQLNNIDGTPFRVDLIPTTNKYARSGTAITPKYITIHNTGNSKRNADAKMHTEYVDDITQYVSWHFTVDDKEIIQELPINEKGFHAGTQLGNATSIGIEICENEGIDFNQAKYNAIKLIYFLIMNTPSLVTNCIVTHQSWSGKYCPHKILDSGWNRFLEQIESYKNSKKTLTLDEALELMSKVGITNNPDSWIKSIKTNTCNPDYIKQIFINMGIYLKNKGV